MALLCSSAARRFYSLQAQMASMVSDDTELAGWLAGCGIAVCLAHSHAHVHTGERARFHSYTQLGTHINTGTYTHTAGAVKL